MLVLSVPRGYSQSPTLSHRTQWLRDHWTSAGRELPFSFKMNGQPVDSAALGKWEIQASAGNPAGDKRLYEIILSDRATGLRVRCELTEFTGHPAIEWVLHFENRGDQETPVLADILPLDAVMTLAARPPILHYAKGALCSMDDFEPMTVALGPETSVHLEPGGGRSSSEVLPFFNLQWPSRGGTIIGIGWSGQWAAHAESTKDGGVRFRAGMALTRLKLRPGESIRTPSVAMLFYDGDWIRGQNLWRRFILDQHRPRVGGKPLAPLLLAGNWGATPAATHLANVKVLSQRELSVDFYWIDAEWFGRGPWFLNAGDWRVKADLYPQGFRPISDALHASGRRLLLWFEPERVCEGTPWAKQFEKWLLAVPKERKFYRWGDRQTLPDWYKAESLRNQIKEGDRLWNLGDPAARKFLTDFISQRVTEFGLDCYRHDANIAPLEFWRAADAADRQGMTEIRWIEGLYGFWDELLRRHPGLIIDNCASGGRRIDLETLSRSTPFWRTDFPGDPIGRQCHTYGISFWAPMNSTGGPTPGRDDDYALRSTFSSCMVINLFGNGDAPQVKGPLPDFPYARAKAALAQYRSLQRDFLGDYYPLTPYSKTADTWLAWQFHRNDLGEGLVQAFRRPKAAQDAVTLKLSGLSPAARYTVLDLDASQQPREMTGRELIEQGIQVKAATRPAALLLTYRQVGGQKVDTPP
jgi:alpha-galactosidase